MQTYFLSFVRIPLVTNDASPADIFEVAMFVTLQNSFVYK